MYQGYSDDITWCSNWGCKDMRCHRNPNHIRPFTPPEKMFSFAELQGTDFCERKGVTKMTDRERLIEILEDTLHEWECDVQPETLSQIAEHLLENGVIVPPVKPGDTVYCINTFFQNDPRINVCEVDALHITSGKNRIGNKKPSYALVRDINMHSLSSRIYFENFGITAFLTREEAEKALNERETK